MHDLVSRLTNRVQLTVEHLNAHLSGGDHFSDMLAAAACTSRGYGTIPMQTDPGHERNMMDDDTGRPQVLASNAGAMASAQSSIETEGAPRAEIKTADRPHRVTIALGLLSPTLALISLAVSYYVFDNSQRSMKGRSGPISVFTSNRRRLRPTIASRRTCL
jgi:hypothetical protein